MSKTNNISTDNAFSENILPENILQEETNEENLKSGYYLSYDAVFKRIFHSLEDDKIVAFIEFIFHKKYSGKCNVRKLLTESFDYEQKKMISDILIMINNDTYHIEIQSTDDEEMAVRVFEYDIRAAIQHSMSHSEADHTINMKLPEPAVIYLRKTDKTPDELRIKFEMTGCNVPFEYKVPAIFVEDYSAEELVRNGLFPMIPFFPMRFEKNLMSKKHTAKDEENVKLKIMVLLKELKLSYDNGKLKRSELSEILCALKNVFGMIIERVRAKGCIRSESEVEETMRNIDEDVIHFIDFVQLEKVMEKRITAKVTDEVTNEITEKVTNEVTAKVTNEVTEKVTNEVTAKVTNEVTEKNRIEFALNMLRNNAPDDMIIKCVGISPEKLEELKASL